jgi:hypothetical protein
MVGRKANVDNKDNGASLPKLTLSAPRTLVVTSQYRDEESEMQQGHFVVMIVILFLLSAALMGVLSLFDGSALNTHAAVR